MPFNKEQFIETLVQEMTKSATKGAAYQGIKKSQELQELERGVILPPTEGRSKKNALAWESYDNYKTTKHSQEYEEQSTIYTQQQKTAKEESGYNEFSKDLKEALDNGADFEKIATIVVDTFQEEDKDNTILSSLQNDGKVTVNGSEKTIATLVTSIGRVLNTANSKIVSSPAQDEEITASKVNEGQVKYIRNFDGFYTHLKNNISTDVVLKFIPSKQNSNLSLVQKDDTDAQHTAFIDGITKNLNGRSSPAAIARQKILKPQSGITFDDVMVMVKIANPENIKTFASLSETGQKAAASLMEGALSKLTHTKNKNLLPKSPNGRTKTLENALVLGMESVLLDVVKNADPKLLEKLLEKEKIAQHAQKNGPLTLLAKHMVKQIRDDLTKQGSLQLAAKEINTLLESPAKKYDKKKFVNLTGQKPTRFEVACAEAGIDANLLKISQNQKEEETKKSISRTNSLNNLEEEITVVPVETTKKPISRTSSQQNLKEEITVVPVETTKKPISLTGAKELQAQFDKSNNEELQQTLDTMKPQGKNPQELVETQRDINPRVAELKARQEKEEQEEAKKLEEAKKREEVRKLDPKGIVASSIRLAATPKPTKPTSLDFDNTFGQGNPQAPQKEVKEEIARIEQIRTKLSPTVNAIKEKGERVERKAENNEFSTFGKKPQPIKDTFAEKEMQQVEKGKVTKVIRTQAENIVARQKAEKEKQLKEEQTKKALESKKAKEGQEIKTESGNNTILEKQDTVAKTIKELQKEKPAPKPSTTVVSGEKSKLQKRESFLEKSGYFNNVVKPAEEGAKTRTVPSLDELKRRGSKSHVEQVSRPLDTPNTPIKGGGRSIGGNDTKKT